MKQIIARYIWLWLSVCLILAGLQAAYADAFVPNEYIIRVAPGSSLQTVRQSIAQLGGEVVRVLPLPNAYLVRMGQPAATTGSGGTLRASRVAATPWVVTRFAPNLKYAKSAIPDDQYWTNNKLWGLTKINMPRAWDTNKGSSSVVVAVLDSGVANHPDLIGRILTEQGYDFVDNDIDASNDRDGHGTHVAGTIAAQGNNQIGVVGVCWDGVQILPIRVLDEYGDGTTDSIILGLNYAWQNGADVVNMSLGRDYGFYDSEMHEQIKILDQAGIILCAAAGNSGFSANPGVGEPASFPECIAVAACSPNDSIAWYSSYGPENEVDITAPGGDQNFGGYDAGIYSTMVHWSAENPIFTYGAEQGTSMACPHVSGAAALLLSAGVPAGDVRNRLESTARKVSSMDKRKYGAGILDVAAAISNGTISIVKPTKGSTVSANPDVRLNIRGIDPASVAVYIDYADANGDGLPDNLALETPVIAGVATAGYINATGTAIAFNWSQVTPNPLATGLHFIYVSARTTVGGDLVSDWGTFEVAGKIIPAGQHLLAFPYGLSTTNPDGSVTVDGLPSDLLIDSATSQPLDFRLQTVDRARLYRWSTPVGAYYSYITGLADPGQNTPRFDDMAWLNPVTRMLLPDTSIWSVPTAGGFLADDASRKLQFPAGTGFWLTLQRDAVLNGAYTEISAPHGFSTYLYKGWNIIGNPYTHTVPLTAVHLNYQGITRTLDEDLRSPRPWLDAIFYGYESGVGYKIVPSDRRLLDPYQGYWVRALVGGISPREALTMTLQ